MRPTSSSVVTPHGRRSSGICRTSITGHSAGLSHASDRIAPTQQNHSSNDRYLLPDSEKGNPVSSQSSNCNEICLCSKVARLSRWTTSPWKNRRERSVPTDRPWRPGGRTQNRKRCPPSELCRSACGTTACVSFCIHLPEMSNSAARQCVCTQRLYESPLEKESSSVIQK